MPLFARRAKVEKLLTPMAPDDPFVRSLGEPDEQFWMGLQAIDWLQRKIPGTSREVTERLLVLSSRRLLVLHPDRQIDDIPYGLMRRPEVRQLGLQGLIHLEARAEHGWVPMEWSMQWQVARLWGSKLIAYFDAAESAG